ncbi:uncharacterized protein LOC100176998 [Ciona intestinalis]
MNVGTYNDGSCWSNKPHETLRIFDLRTDRARKSKIPIPSGKHRKNSARNDYSPTQVHPDKVLVDNNETRIPVFANTGRLKTDRSTMPIRTKNIQEKLASRARVRQKSPPSSTPRECPNKKKKTMKLRGLELAAIPMEIFRLSDLESLFLSPERESCLSYKLPYVPKEIGKLQSLQTLVLDTNELESIPEEISGLKQLKALTLSNNCLTELPNGFSNLKNLRSLHLANNRFCSLPVSVCHLSNLGFLDMTDNDLDLVPEEIGMLAESLHTLLLFMNKIEKLPSSFSTLTNLTCLWLGENCLEELPRDFGELFRLDWGSRPCSSNIAGNPLARPPMDVCQLGVYAIRKYFYEDMEAGGASTVT